MIVTVCAIDMLLIVIVCAINSYTVVTVFISILRSKFDREESLQCLKEIDVPILSLFGDNDRVSPCILCLNITGLS